MNWYPVCPFDRLPVDRAVCVLVGHQQVALVRTHAGSLYAVSNQDPVGGAMVMSRGIVGSRGDADVLMSPMDKLAYDLVTGEGLDRSGVWLQVHEVRVIDGAVEVGLAPAVPQLA